MKPPTIEELRELAEAHRAIHEDDDREARLIALALERWAEQIERKQNHISHYLRKKESQ